ncbi:hypothetical protein CVIRNUC_005056 [Coccomyxa viridis]|uniref:Uncharacterized protein n=1 Tax=Coccomyxa viridis TaxID=1274662 RepID=A0AAV1I3H9_9CHLO|nr:hypothetical protein CVIRNUC_005056 [Coccomyxa viridis]
MRTDVNMLGRNMSAFRNACPLESSIRGSSVSIIRNMKRQKTTASIIEDKQVVVVGGNRGIGLEYVRQFLEKGNSVVATARTLAQAAELHKLAKKESKLMLTEVDVSNVDSIKVWARKLKEEVTQVDYLINNAGVAKWADLGSLTEEDMLQLFRTNTLGPLMITQEVLREGLLKDGSVVANMTSKMGSMEDNTSGGSYAYRASKAALNAVTKSLALDLKEKGITVALLHPGWVKTDMTNNSGLIDAKTSAAGLISVLESGKPLSCHWYDYKHEEIPW